MIIGDIQKATTSVPSLNTWRPYEEERQKDDYDIEWTLSKNAFKKGKVERAHYRNSKNTIYPSAEQNNTNRVGDYGSHQDYVPSMSIQDHLVPCIIRIESLKMNCSHYNHLPWNSQRH